MIRCHVCGKTIPSPALGIPRVMGNRVVITCGPSCARRAAQGRFWTWGARHAADFLLCLPRAAADTLFAAPSRNIAIVLLVLTLAAILPMRRWHFQSDKNPPWVRFDADITLHEPQWQELRAGADAGTLRQRTEPVLWDPVSALQRAREILEASLQEESLSIWDLDAIDVLAQEGDVRAISRLRKILETDAGPVRRKAASALARAGVKEGLDVLRAELGSANPMTAAMAAIELGKIGDGRALLVLKRFMDRSDIQMAACEAAVLLKYEPARIRLVQELRQASRLGDRVRAALALAQAGDRQGLDVLLEAFGDGQFRFMAALGLAALGDARAIPVLRLSLEHTSLRREAAESLRRFGVNDDYALLLRDMESSHAPTRISAAVAVYILTTPASGKGAAHG